MATYLNMNKIGSGGFGTVWKCKRKDDGRIFAKKSLDDGSDEDAVRRFKREVRIISQLDHPNIVKVIWKRLSEEPYFYIMPLFRASLREQIPQIVGDTDRIRKIFTAVLDAVEYAHGQGIIHRDLKPENVLLNSDEDVVVSDFGLGRDFDAESTRQTQTGFGLGTPLYMAPEQFSDAKNCSSASDIYACGRILLELYSGILTLGGQDFTNLPPEIEVIVRRCCEPEPSRRFLTVTDLKIAYQSIYDASVLSEQLSALDSVITRLSAVDECSEDDAKVLYEGLLARIADGDLIQNAVMSVTPKAFSVIERLDVEAARSIIKRFVEVMTGQGWPFSFTDKIGSKCRELFDVMSDFEVKADLIYCACEVGASHNRWHVMEIAADLLARRKEAGEVIPLKERLDRIPQYHDVLSHYVKREKLAPLLKTIFKLPEE